MVLYLRLSVIEYAVITAISFGGGSFFGYVGGKAGDRFGYKKTAVLSNLFVPLLSLSGLSINVFEVASLEMQEVSDKENAVSESSIEHLNKNIYYKVLIATSLYGFSAYSFGFPIITIAIASKDNVLGVASYVVFLAVSSVTGLFAGKVIAKSVGELALGYILGGIGSLGIGLTIISKSLVPVSLQEDAVAVTNYLKSLKNQ